MRLQKNINTKGVFFLFLKVFIILLIFLLILPQLIDSVLFIYYDHGNPGGNTVLVNKTFGKSDEIFNQMLYYFKKILLFM